MTFDNMTIRSIGFLAFSCILFSSFREQPPQRFELSGRAQGTTWHITYFASDSIDLMPAINQLLSEVDQSLSLYQPNSIVNKWNQSKKGIRVDSHFNQVLTKAIDVFHDTEGYFDITVFPLTSAWGFGPRKNTELPDSSLIKGVMPCVNSQLLKVRGRKITKKKPCVQIDPNGIAQGYTVDQLAAILDSRGIMNYLVELGGEIRVRGRKLPSGEKLSIGIEAPGDDPLFPLLQKRVYMESGAITTSGNYRRYLEADGKRITHLLDPHTGYPIQNELVSVTVIAPDAITADAYDNALMAMGLERALNWVDKRPELAAFFIYQRDGRIRDTMSARFKQFLQP
jgi:thiamine biosynthesis lipoprotein